MGAGKKKTANMFADTNMKVFLSNTNHPLAYGMGYIVNKFECVRGGVRVRRVRPCILRSKLNKFENA